LCFYTLYFLTVFFVYVHICIVCYPCGVTINDDDDDDDNDLVDEPGDYQNYSML